MSMRLVIKYTKEERVKYISHLDFLRLVQRAIRRADIPVAYSQGFNPHPRLSFASALAVGVTSEGEYLDIYLKDDMDPELLCNKMNEKLPSGIRFVEGRIVDEKLPSLMSLIERAEYAIVLPGEVPQKFNLPSVIGEFLSQQEIWAVRTNRKGSRQIDIRPMIHGMDAFERDGNIVIKAIISSGSKANLRPDLLINALFDFAGLPIVPDLFFHIHRLDLYLLQEGKWVTPIGME
ncbi:MAG: TIGR03936 family radical SAM-associated protein [Caldicoprobacterales bacterium]|jgi:radical SAM-linked protein